MTRTCDDQHVMTTRQVILVRHGPTLEPERCHGQRSDPSLSDVGHTAVAALATRLPTFGTLITSPAARARQTADHLSSDCRAVDARWAERNFGEWEGRKWSELWSEVGEDVTATTQNYLAFEPPGAESAAEVMDRITTAVADLSPSAPVMADSAASTAPVGVVTHGGPIQLALSVCLGLPLDAALAFRPARATSVWLTETNGSWVLERLGW